MKYLKLKFLLMFFALAMAIPPAWAEGYELTYSITSYNNGTLAGAPTGVSAVVSTTATQMSNGGSQLTSGNSFKLTLIGFTSRYKVTGIKLNYCTNASKGTGTFKALLGNEELASYSITKVSSEGTTPRDAVLSFNETPFDGNDLELNVNATTNSVYVIKFTVTYADNNGSSLTPVTLSFPESNYTAFLGQSFTARDLTINPSAAASEVTYRSSDESVATVDASGNVTPVDLGTTTITASISNSETYTNASASYTLTVKPDPDELAILDFTSPNYWTPALPEGSDNKFVEETEFSDGTYTVKVAGSTGEGCYWLNSGDALLIGKLGAYLQLPAFDKPVERIVIDGHSSASGKVTQNIFVGDDAVSTETTSAKVTQTYEIAPAYQAAGNVYTLRVTNANNTQIQKIYVYFKEQSSDPELSVTPPSITINDEGGSFSVFGQNLGGDNVGVTRTNGEFKPVLSATTGSVTNHDEGYENKWWYFTPASDNGGSVNGKINVTYEGYGFSGEGSFSVGNGATGSKLVNVTYKPDIYIVGDYGINEGWNFTDGTNKMSEAGGVYSIELNVENTNTYVAFARKVGAGVGFNTRYVFTPVSDNNWEMDADSKEGTINVYGAKPIHFQYAGLYVIEINTNNSPATFTITRTLPQAAKPKITPNGGNFVASQTVSITSTTEDAAIYYTTDGVTEPTAETGTLYEDPITLTATTTLKAIAVKDGMRPSEVATATFTKTGIETLAGENGVNSLASGKNFTFVGEVVVTANKSYKTNNGNTNTVVFIRDLNQNNASGTGGSVFYNTAADLEVKTKLAPGWTGKTMIYNGWTEITDAGNITTNGTVDEVVPFDRSGQTLTQANQSEYIILRNITINGDKATWTDGSKTNVEYDLYDRFGVGYEDGEYEYLEGVVNVFINSNNNKIQVYPLDFKKVVKPLAVTLPAAPAENYKVGQVIKVKATVENGSENTELTYKVGDETLTIGEDGNVTLPNKKSGEVILTVTAVDGERTATDSKTYVFDPAEALTITLTPATGSYYVGDERNVTVTVEGAIATNPTITYKFGEEEAQTYDAETGIVLPTAQAGTINLTVTVDDGGYEHTGATTATGTYTVNHKALTITLNPATAEFTVGAKAKVKVTVENAVGDYVVSGMIGEKNYDVDENGYITLPNDKAVEEMILTVTAIDERENAVEATATGTYKFNAAPSITFDLEIVPEAENNAYAVGDEVKVKATNIKNTIGDYEVTYMVGQNKLTPDNDGYVTFTSAVADEVNLTVSVDDLFEHESEATQTVKFTFDKKAATVEYSAETGTATFGVEPENLPTLTVDPEDLEINYTSSHQNVATIDADGNVAIKGAGKTTITATFEGNDMYEAASDSYELTVNKADLEVSFNNETPDPITIGEDFTAPVLSEVPEGTTVSYKSDNENVAKVDATTGKVEIVGVGSAVITATVTGANYNETSASYTITVNDVVVALAAPTFAPAAGTYTEPKEVAIACATPGVTIEYSINGGETQTYTKPFLVSENCIVTATAKMGTRTVYTPATSSATYTINAAAAAAIADDYYTLQSNAAEVSGKYANVAGRRTLNFVADADKQAGTVFRVMTDPDTIGQVETLRSQAVDLQGYANRAMAYVPKVIDLVLSTLANSSLGDPETPGTGILGENGLDLILNKFYEGFDYNLYVEEGTEGTYRIYGRTPSMQHVVDFYHENTAQVEEKLPKLEGYINQVLDKIRSKIPAPYDANVVVPFSLKTVRDRIADKYGITLIDPTQDLMGFYRQVLNNKEYVWDFAYQTAMMYVDVIKQTGTYQNLPNEYKLFVEKMEKVRPDTKYYIIERGNELDYISENNGDIIKNDPRTLWTLTKRENFTVNVPVANKLNDSYYTTLYTDFGYELPTGVKAYAVTGIDENDVAQLTEITGAIPAQTPVLLKADADGDKVLTLKKESRGGAIEGNLLEGPDYLINKYQFEAPTVVNLFSMAEGFVPADVLDEYSYLKLRNSGTVNNKYFWNVNSDLENITGINVLRSLSTNTGKLAFSDDSMTETNKAFMVSETEPVIYLSIDTVATPTLSLVAGSYTGEQTLTISCATDDATISYSTDGGKNWTEGTSVTLTDDCTVMVKAEKEGMIPSEVVTAEYIIDEATVLPDVPAMKGYYQIKNNENEMYANVAGRRTLNFKSETEAESNAGTIFYLETNGKGQVQSLRSQGVDLQGYANRAMHYVPDMVKMVVNTLQAEGSGEILGENGLNEIMEKFNECFDYHLYVEPVGQSWRIYGKTPSMQHVVDFYREHTAQVEAKLPMLEDFINDALTKLRNKIGGSTVFTDFSLHQIWEKMGGNLPEPVVGDDAAIMDFYRAVLNNKNYVWDFAYQTAQIYWNNVKDHPRYDELKAQLGEYADYIDEFVNQVRPDFKYYVIQRGNEPDYISQGNAEINEPRSLWTLEPRETFKLNSAGELFGCPLAPQGVGGYFTTNYTDFAYTLPEGVTAYKVTDVDNDGEATLEALEGIIPAQTPVLLVAEEDGAYQVTLTTEPATADTTGNMLVGPDYLIKLYQFKTPMVVDLFTFAQGILGEDLYNTYVAPYEYLQLRYSGTVNNKYFWNVNSDLGDITGVSVVRSLSTETGNLAFSDNAKTETNKAFLVSDTFDVITLPSLERGDVNHDGYVNLLDVTDLIDRLLVIPDAEHLKACPYCSDVDGNGSVNIKDVTVLIDILLGNISPDPEEGDGN